MERKSVKALGLIFFLARKQVGSLDCLPLLFIRSIH